MRKCENKIRTPRYKNTYSFRQANAKKITFHQQTGYCYFLQAWQKSKNKDAIHEHDEVVTFTQPYAVA